MRYDDLLDQVFALRYLRQPQTLEWDWRLPNGSPNQRQLVKDK
jgi:hypothetical protein